MMRPRAGRARGRLIRSADLWRYPPRQATPTALPKSIREGRCCGARTVCFSYLLPGALLEALAPNRDGAPDGLQHGPGHRGPPAQGLMAPDAALGPGLSPCQYSGLCRIPHRPLVVEMPSHSSIFVGRRERGMK